MSCAIPELELYISSKSVAERLRSASRAALREADKHRRRTHLLHRLWRVDPYHGGPHRARIKIFSTSSNTESRRKECRREKHRRPARRACATKQQNGRHKPTNRSRSRLAEPCSRAPCCRAAGGKSVKPTQDFMIDFEQWLAAVALPRFRSMGPVLGRDGRLRLNSKSERQPYFIAQLGDGDEANSIPVLLPASKARQIPGCNSHAPGWGGMEAKATCLLGHQQSLREAFRTRLLSKLFGGLARLLSLFIGEDDKDHYIEPQAGDENTRSIPAIFGSASHRRRFTAAERRACINDVYFIWEHVNLRQHSEAIAYTTRSDGAQGRADQKANQKRSDPDSQILVPSYLERRNYSPDTIYRILISKSGEQI